MPRCVVALLALFAASEASGSDLDARIKASIAGFHGVVYLYAKNLDTGVSYGIRENERVRTASTIKLPIMAAIFKAVDASGAKWADQIVLHEGEKVSGSGVIREFSDGDRFTVADLVHMMIVVSDNTATNLLLDRFPADSVNGYMDTLGLKQTRALRKIRGDGNDLKQPSGWSAAGRLSENQRFGIGVSTPREMVMLLEKIVRGEVVNADASREMIAILERQQDSDCMRRRLPDVRIANKTGALDHLRSDAGVVFSPHGRIAMAITCEDMPEVNYTPDNAGALMIAELARTLVEGLASK